MSLFVGIFRRRASARTTPTTYQGAYTPPVHEQSIQQMCKKCGLHQQHNNYDAARMNLCFGCWYKTETPQDREIAQDVEINFNPYALKKNGGKAATYGRIR